ncbi:MAG: tRNA (adenosine(37)-N6)-threonylcarbamoyltransferase complex ATPase subunit type 1 TsaE [Kordiimonadaceae bacterium]|nr:tRNA (adenosine(37)-N6)-threonylcarbamoyltransferase complex ATPase subunit type 1 TsaE [Kordiimonadaceae bacterium]
MSNNNQMAGSLHESSCPDQMATTALAARLAGIVVAGDLIALSGGLGAGKTTFARAFIRALLQDSTAEVPSPTSTLVQTYETSVADVVHTDLYRLQGAEDVYDLGIEDDRPEAVFLVEWPDRMPDYWWHDALEIRLKRPQGAPAGEDEARTVGFYGAAESWAERLKKVVS